MPQAPPYSVVPYKLPSAAKVRPLGVPPSLPPVKPYRVAILVPEALFGMTARTAPVLLIEPRELLAMAGEWPLSVSRRLVNVRAEVAEPRTLPAYGTAVPFF